MIKRTFLSLLLAVQMLFSGCKGFAVQASVSYQGVSFSTNIIPIDKDEVK